MGKRVPTRGDRAAMVRAAVLAVEGKRRVALARRALDGHICRCVADSGRSVAHVVRRVMSGRDKKGGVFLREYEEAGGLPFSYERWASWGRYGDIARHREALRAIRVARVEDRLFERAERETDSALAVLRAHSSDRERWQVRQKVEVRQEGPTFMETLRAVDAVRREIEARRKVIEGRVEVVEDVAG